MTRGRRRVIALSEADRRRLASGELARPEDALGEPEPEPPGPGTDVRAPGSARRSTSDDATNDPATAPAIAPAAATGGVAAGEAADGAAAGVPPRVAPTGRAGRARPRPPSVEDERLLREVPPHFGRL